MSERYSSVFTLPQNLYTDGSPVVLSAGALLKDNTTGTILAQLKFKNISQKEIQALSIEISNFDTAGRSIGVPKKYTYLDLSAKLSQDFGAKTPIMLDDSSTRSIQVKLCEIIFSDSTIHTYEDFPLVEIPKQSFFPDEGILKQFKIKYGNNAYYLPQKHEDLWLCSCGNANKNTMTKCPNCSLKFFDFNENDLQGLVEAKEEEIRKQQAILEEQKRIKEENQRIEKEKQEKLRLEREEAVRIAREKAAKKAKTRKNIFKVILSLLTISAIAAVFVTVIIPKYQNNQMLKLIESGEYNQAIELAQKLNADTISVNEFNLTLNDTGFTVSKYTGSSTTIEIPEGVTEIGSNAFKDSTSLKSIAIPDSVTSIGSNAFSECTSLTSITIPDSVTLIGAYAFNGCTSLTSITIPDSVTEIGTYAFIGCTSLTSIAIPASVTEIASNAFNGCTSLTSITIPDSVTEIASNAFNGCTSLTSITIPDSVTSIGSNAFNDCTSLTSITIPDSVTEIGTYAFIGCTSLTSIAIPASVTEISSSAFSGCTSLTSITIPDSVTSIGTYAFKNCTSLTSITIPASVNQLLGGSFSGCTSLTSIIIDQQEGNFSPSIFPDNCEIIYLK